MNNEIMKENSTKSTIDRVNNTITVTKVYTLSIKLYRQYSASPIEVKEAFKEILIVAQNGICPWCERDARQEVNMVIDHDHITDRIRGLVCQSCNSQIGQVEKHLDYFK